MKYLYRRIFIALLLLTMLSLSAFAQPKVFNGRKRYWSFGLNAGTSNYRGDLAPSFDFKLTRPTLGIDATRRLFPNWSVRAGLNWIKIAGDDYVSTKNKVGDVNFKNAASIDRDLLERYIRNLSFRNSMIEFSVVAIYDFLPNKGYFTARRKWAPYISAGISVLTNNPEARRVKDVYTEISGDMVNITTISKNNDWIKLRPLKTENVEYSSAVIAIPLGAGVRYALSDNINIGLELNYRITFSDYLDDVSDKYIDLQTKNALRAAMSNRSLNVYSASGEQREELLDVAPAYVGPNSPAYTKYKYSNGDEYLAVTGFTHAKGGINRGNPNNKDHILTTTLRFEYLLGKGPTKPKLR